VLWCCNAFIKEYTGEMGVLAIVPLFAFFGAGVLTKDDFNGFLWNVVMLAMGGLALGQAVQSSGLLLSISAVGAATETGFGLLRTPASRCRSFTA
jgi:tryptophan synthase/phosphate transporter